MGVYLKSGELRYMPYLGYFGANTANKVNGVPVKIDICAYAQDIASDRIEIPDNMVMQGCLCQCGVFAVIDERGRPKLVPKPSLDQSKILKPLGVFPLTPSSS